MKKITVLFITTIIVLAAIISQPFFTKEAIEAKEYKLKLSDAESTITASGKLQYASGEYIITDNYVLVDKLYASNGRRVRKGEPVAVVYELTQDESIPFTKSDVDKLLRLISASSISEEISRQIKKYSVRRVISSPGDGVVSELSCSENEILNKKASMMRICDSDSYSVSVNINESCIEKIKCGQKAKIFFTALEGKAFEGTVRSISCEARQSSSLSGKETSVEVTVELEKTSEPLRAGYTAECTIITSKDKNMLIVPYEFINSDDTGEYVYVSDGNRARKSYIETGREYKDGIAVTKGLDKDDTILLSDSGIKDGSILKKASGGS